MHKDTKNYLFCKANGQPGGSAHQFFKHICIGGRNRAMCSKCDIAYKFTVLIPRLIEIVKTEKKKIFERSANFQDKQGCGNCSKKSSSF